MEKRKCSILIPHFNNLEGLYTSIKSVFCDQNIDIIVVDDGSVERPDRKEVQKRCNENVGIHLLFSEQNEGIEKALNRGLEYCINANYEFVARLDCGDVCDRQRFNVQIDLLEINPEVGIVGSWVRFFWNNRDRFLLKLPHTNKTINRYKYLNSPFCHPAIMVRTSVFKEVGLYSYQYHRAEDYELYLRILDLFKGVNIPKSLTSSELNPAGISLSNRKKQLLSRLKIQKKYYKWNSIYSNVGILRTIFIYFLPYAILKKIKAIVYKNR